MMGKGEESQWSSFVHPAVHSGSRKQKLAEIIVTALTCRFDRVSVTVTYWRTWGKTGERGTCKDKLSLGALAGLQRLHFDQVVRFASGSVMLPHLQVESLQVYGVLFGVEERAANTLLPHAGTDLLQAERNKGRTCFQGS